MYRPAPEVATIAATTTALYVTIVAHMREARAKVGHHIWVLLGRAGDCDAAAFLAIAAILLVVFVVDADVCAAAAAAGGRRAGAADTVRGRRVLVCDQCSESVRLR